MSIPFPPLFRGSCENTDNVEHLRTRLFPLPHGLKLVSFDVFDTVLPRDIEPFQIQLEAITARKVVQLLGEHESIHYSAEDIADLMARIEAQEGKKKGGYSFPELIGKLVQRLTGERDENLEVALITQGLQVEKEARYARQGMPELLREVRDQGTRLIAISDLWFDREQIDEIFDDKGIDECFDAVYLAPPQGNSSETPDSWAHALRHAMERERVLPGQMLHIGGNRNSGCLAPRSLGINSLTLKDRNNLRRKQATETYGRLALRNPYWRGRHLLQLVRPPASNGNFFFDYGYSVLGPVYAAFILGVTEVVKRKNIRHLYFLAREGELFLRIYKHLEPALFKNRSAPDTTYLYVSRRATALSSIWRGLPFETAVAPLYNPKQQGLTTIINVFGLPPEAFNAIARKHGFEDLTKPIPDWKTHTRFRELIEDPAFQNIVVKHASDNKKLLEQYLAQEGFFSGEPVAFIDIGWNGTIQKFIQDSLADREDYPHVHGLYLGFAAGIPYRFDSAKNTLSGLLYDSRRQDPREDSFRNFEEIFEEGARALHPTTIGYRRHPDTGRVEPLFREDHSSDRAVELEHNKNTAAFHAGVLCFSREFIRGIALTGYRFEDIKPFLNTLVERAVEYPSKEETRALMQLNHTEDFGMENIMEFGNDISRGPIELARPMTLAKKIRRSNWRAGTVRSTGIPGGNYFLRLFDILRLYR